MVLKGRGPPRFAPLGCCRPAGPRADVQLKARPACANPVGWLRDYLVRVNPGSDDLLLGKAYLAVGPARAPLGFFLLERRRQFEPDAELTRRLGARRRGATPA